MGDVYFCMTLRDNDFKGVLIDTANYLLEYDVLSKCLGFDELKDIVNSCIITESNRRSQEMCNLLGKTYTFINRLRNEKYIKKNLTISFKADIDEKILVNGNNEYVFIKIKTDENGGVTYSDVFVY